MEQTQWTIRVPDGYEVKMWAGDAKQVELPSGLTVVQMTDPMKLVEGTLLLPAKLAVVTDITTGNDDECDEILALIDAIAVCYNGERVMIVVDEEEIVQLPALVEA
jgi:hypothetical protein